MSTSTGPARWAHAARPPLPAHVHGEVHRPRRDSRTEGYWQEWTPDDPQPNTGYDAELHLAAGAHILYATANVRLASEATAASDVECSLFVGEDNVSLHQLRMSPGDVACLAATSHADVKEPTTVQWVCGSTTGPWRLDLAVTAVKVDILHHVG